MKSYDKKSYLKKKVVYESQKNPKQNIQLVHQIFDTINISLLVLVTILFFLSFDSQKKWSNTYKILTNTKSMNNNLIDYISKTEQFYISKLESLNTYRKTKPKDLIYLDKISEKNESFIKKNFRIFNKGLRDSKFQKGY